MQNPSPPVLFQVFNEIGIIDQLSKAMLEARMPKGLIAPHFAVLNHLTRVGDGSTPMDMARAFQVPKTSMTHTLAGLEKHGLIEMRPNPDDRRSKQVWLTQQGRDMRAGIIAGMAPDFRTLSDGLDVSRLMQILPVLTELRVFLDNHRQAASERGPD